jgi:hypothetical protein
MLLMLGVYQLITSRIVRHWTAIPPADLSYAQCVMATHAKRSLIRLCFAILLRAVVFLGVAAALTWLALHSPPPGWNDWTLFKKASWFVLLIFLMTVATYPAISGYRVVMALRSKYSRR